MAYDQYDSQSNFMILTLFPVTGDLCNQQQIWKLLYSFQNDVKKQKQFVCRRRATQINKNNKVAWNNATTSIISKIIKISPVVCCGFLYQLEYHTTRVVLGLP